MWDLVSWPGTEPRSSVLSAQSLRHCLQHRDHQGSPSYFFFKFWNITHLIYFQKPHRSKIHGNNGGGSRKRCSRTTCRWHRTPCGRSRSCTTWRSRGWPWPWTNTTAWMTPTRRSPALAPAVSTAWLFRPEKWACRWWEATGCLWDGALGPVPSWAGGASQPHFR